MEDARREARDVMAGIARGDGVARRLAAHVLELSDKAEALRNEVKALRAVPLEATNAALVRACQACLALLDGRNDPDFDEFAARLKPLGWPGHQSEPPVQWVIRTTREALASGVTGRSAE
jgi:hypothetical protein